MGAAGPHDAQETALPETRLARFAQWLLDRFGWTYRTAPLPGPKGIVVVYPHTSNWDFVIGLLYKWRVALPFSYMAKDSLFSGVTGATLGRLLRRWGGVPVKRDEQRGTVEQIAEQFEKATWMWLAITPEGTRGRTEYLRSGFYRMAQRANVPIALGYIDYAKKEVGVTAHLVVTGDRERDLEVLRAFYRNVTPRFPEKAGRLAFREEPRAGE